jgi:hypothetical protein
MIVHYRPPEELQKTVQKRVSEVAMVRKLALLIFATLLPMAAVRANNSTAPVPAFDQLKTLVGEWEGTNSGQPVKVTYTLVANGTALMERLQPANEPDMITMYSADGDHVVVTHYCSGGNQPQMVAQATTGKTEKLSFTLVRITGLKTPDDDHMVGLVLTLSDKDHLTQEWKYQSKGKISANLVQFTRKPEKSAAVVPPGN